MLRITKETDYGILVLTCFARAQGLALTTKQIAEQTDIPYRMVCKVLNLLTRKGLLVSQRGMKGGYSLERAPETVTLDEAISALEGPVALTECAKSDCECQALERCSVQDHWSLINRAFRQALRGVTLRAMAAPADPSVVPFLSKAPSKPNPEEWS